ncbi:MAG: DUF302 domain-containing protein, partial [Sedimenticola sp.]
MGIIKNLLALIGFIAVVAVIFLGVKAKDIAGDFDPDAPAVYMELIENVLATKSAAAATVWKVPVAEGMSAEEVEEAMKLVANELNMANVGELPLSLDVAAKIGKDYRFVKIYMFCDSLTAAKMLDYDDTYSAYLPCRITLIEDKTGKLWLMALNMDLMIYGGAPLPTDLKEA